MLSPPDGSPTNSQFLLPTQNGLMAFSHGLLSMLSLGAARNLLRPSSRTVAYTAALAMGDAGGTAAAMALQSPKNLSTTGADAFLRRCLALCRAVSAPLASALAFASFA